MTSDTTNETDTELLINNEPSSFRESEAPVLENYLSGIIYRGRERSVDERSERSFASSKCDELKRSRYYSDKEKKHHQRASSSSSRSKRNEQFKSNEGYRSLGKVEGSGVFIPWVSVSSTNKHVNDNVGYISMSSGQYSSLPITSTHYSSHAKTTPLTTNMVQPDSLPITSSSSKTYQQYQTINSDSKYSRNSLGRQNQRYTSLDQSSHLQNQRLVSSTTSSRQLFPSQPTESSSLGIPLCNPIKQSTYSTSISNRVSSEAHIINTNSSRLIYTSNTNSSAQNCASSPSHQMQISPQPSSLSSLSHYIPNSSGFSSLEPTPIKEEKENFLSNSESSILELSCRDSSSFHEVKKNNSLPKIFQTKTGKLFLFFQTISILKVSYFQNSFYYEQQIL